MSTPTREQCIEWLLMKLDWFGDPRDKRMCEAILALLRSPSLPTCENDPDVCRCAECTKARSLRTPAPGVHWENRHDLDFVRYKSGAISEKCPKCARHSPECASPGSCHYDVTRPDDQPMGEEEREALEAGARLCSALPGGDMTGATYASHAATLRRMANRGRP